MKKTILIPAYNAATSIAETLLSVQGSLTSECEIDCIYISDDFSTDDTIAICESTWTHPTTKMLILRASKNKGERENVNTAMQLLEKTYDWVLILHADDIAKQDWLQSMCRAIDKGSKDLATVCSSYDVLWEDGRIDAGEDKNGEVVIKGSNQAMKDTLISGTWWHISGCAISIKILKQSGGFHAQMPQYGDMEWILKILQQGLEIIYIPKSLTIYRQTRTSVSSESFKKHRDIYEYANLIMHYRSLLSSKHIGKLYLRFNSQLIKRIISSTIKGNFKRLVGSIKMMFYIFRLFYITKKSEIHL